MNQRSYPGVGLGLGVMLTTVTATLAVQTPVRAAIPRHNTLESPVSVEAAYREKSRLIVVLSAAEERNHPELASGNRVFYGDDHDLWQLEASVPSELGAVETELSFFRGVTRGAENEGGLTLTPSEARVECSPGDRGDQGQALAHLSETEQSDLEHRLAAGSTRLHPLPDVLEPLYLFAPSGAHARNPSSERRSSELVLVEGPIFNFYGDYRVTIGAPHHKPTEYPVSTDYRTWRSMRPGEIRFASGGGMSIPLTINLVPKADSEERAAPTLIRGTTADPEQLEIPRLSRTEIVSMGFGKPEYARLHTPCDPLGGILAQVAPRTNGR